MRNQYDNYMYCIVGKVHPRSVCVVNLQHLPEHWETENHQFIAAIFETLCPPYSTLTLNDLGASSLLRYQRVWNHLEDIKGYQITLHTFFFKHLSFSSLNINSPYDGDVRLHSVLLCFPGACVVFLPLFSTSRKADGADLLSTESAAPAARLG